MKGILGILFAFVSLSAYAVSPNDPLPTTILSCSGSIIADIGSRLEGDKNFETGAYVRLKNNGFSVASDKFDSAAAV